jgi:hypothetical protein
MPDAIRMLNRETIEVVVDGRSVVIDGELAVEEGGQPGFWLMPSRTWRWADGQAMADAERAALVERVPSVGAANGWVLSLDEGPHRKPAPIRASFVFHGFETLDFTAPGAAATVPGRLAFERGKPQFTIDLSRPWTSPDGAALSTSEIGRIAELIRREASANNVVIRTAGHTRGTTDLA